MKYVFDFLQLFKNEFKIKTGPSSKKKKKKKKKKLLTITFACDKMEKCEFDG